MPKAIYNHTIGNNRTRQKGVITWIREKTTH